MGGVEVMPEQRRRLKVLLGCYACDPHYGSEPGMGWNFASRIAKFHDVHVLDEEGEFREPLTRFAAEHPEQVEAFTGDVIGGVCPFAIEHPNVTTYLDVSLQRFDIVYPAAGSANSAVKLSLPELEACSGSAGWIDVCKGWQAGG